jgi:hypothetical protein
MPQRIFDARSACVQARQRAHGYGCTRATGGPLLQVLLQESRRVRRRLSTRLAARPRHVRALAQRRTASAKQATVHTRLRYAAQLHSAAIQSATHVGARDLAYGCTRFGLDCVPLPASSTHSHGSRDDSGWHRASNMRQVLVLLGAQLRRRVPRKLPVGRLRCQWLRPVPPSCVTHRQHTTNGSATWQRAAALPSAGGVSSCTLGALGMLGAVVMQERSVPRLG